MPETGNVASVMSEYIAQCGVTHTFTYPGDPTIELLEALRHKTDVVLARREGTAAFMAEGYAQATGRLGVCVSTLGPGSTALVNGVAAATWDRVPMLAISGQIESEREQYFTHQVVDHQALFGPITKWAGRVEPGAVDTIMRKAIRTATANRPGAVHLSASAQDFTAPAAASEIHLPPMSATATGYRVERSESGVREPVQAVAASRRPVILVGVGAVRSHATEQLHALAEAIGAPLVVAPMAKGVVSETHPYFAGVLDMACNQIMWQFLSDSDLILAVGFDAVELIKPWTVKVPVVHIDEDPNTDQIYLADTEVIGHIPTILEALTEAWTGEPRRSESDVEAHRSNLRNSYYSGRLSNRLNPTDVIDVMRAALAEDAIVSCDVGSHKLLVGQGWQTTTPRGVLMSNGLSSMGFGLPAAIGAKLALPERPVAALIGDGGFAMTATELRLAASLKLPLTVVVFVDESLNRIELKQSALNYPSTATRIERTDLVKLADSMGCEGIRVSSLSELQEAATGLDTLSGPRLIEAIIDPAQYQAQF